jgi:hypothetical protein
VIAARTGLGAEVLAPPEPKVLEDRTNEMSSISVSKGDSLEPMGRNRSRRVFVGASLLGAALLAVTLFAVRGDRKPASSASAGSSAAPAGVAVPSSASAAPSASAPPDEPSAQPSVAQPNASAPTPATKPRRPQHPAVRPSSSKDPNCTIRSYFDDQGIEHFTKDCR